LLDKHIFDVGIIGGGFGGLSAALLLGRYLRSVVIFDTLKNRNYNIHGYLGFENTPVRDAIHKSWQDVLQYSSILHVEKKVNNVRKDGDSNLFLISVTTSSDSLVQEKDLNNAYKKEFRTRHLIIATGVDQIKPEIKDFDKFLGKGIWHCPHCDGFATTNKKLIIIASDDDPYKAIRYAKVFLGWTTDITLFLQGVEANSNKSKYILTDKQRRETSKLGIKVIEDDWIVEVVGDSKTNNLTGVLSNKSTFYKADILFYYMGTSINNNIPLQLGCKLDKGYVKVNEKQQTSISKVYAVGDIDRDKHYAILASASGAVAAQNIYKELLRESISIKKEHIKD
jgi:thioredoxin reductase